MTVRKLMWIIGLTLCCAGGASAQGPGCAPGAPCGAPVASSGCQTEATCCVKVKGPKKCCLFNRLMERLAVHEQCQVQAPCQATPFCAPVCAKPCPAPCAPVCAKPCAPVCAPTCSTPSAPVCAAPCAPKHRFKCKAKPTCCVETSCAPPCDSVNPPLSPIPSAPPIKLPQVGAAPLQPVDGMGSAPSVDPTMKLLETMQASQAADAKAFQELMEKKIATMTALRGMQQNDAKSLAQLESLIRQTRQAMAPVAPEPIKAPAPIKVQEAPKATEENTTSAKQVESLTRLINDLDREVKQISHKVDQIQK